MKQSEFNEYLSKRYEDQVNWYDGKSVLYKRVNYLFQIPTILIAAILPIFAALEQKWITVALSAIVSIFVGTLNLGRFEEKWHNYRSTCENLKRELQYYKAKIDGYENAGDPEKLFIANVESMITSEHSKWKDIEKTKGKGNE
jgi:hypothetical protein